VFLVLQKACAHSQRVCVARAAVIAGAGSLGRKLIFANRQDCFILSSHAGEARKHERAGSAQRVMWLFERASEGSREAAELRGETPAENKNSIA
jgi:hypothetical protein